MKFEMFRAELLSVGIGECEFSLRSSKKDGFIGVDVKDGKVGYVLCYDKAKYFFDDPRYILQKKAFGGKTIEEIWDDVQLDCINGLDEEEYIAHILDDNFYIKEFIADYKLNGTVNEEALAKKLTLSESGGDIVLYAGSRELNEFSISDNYYFYCFFDTKSKRMYTLKKENGLVSLEYACHLNDRKKIDVSLSVVGRKFDGFAPKSAENKSDRYGLVLKYYRFLRIHSIISPCLGITCFISAFATICTSALKSLYPTLFWSSIISFALIVTLAILNAILLSKKTDKLEDKLFSKNNMKISFSDMFIQIQKEADRGGFSQLHEELMQFDKKIKLSYIDKNGSRIDVRFNTALHKFYIEFANRFAILVIDDDKAVRLDYSEFKDYDNLEEKIYMTIIEYL